MFICLGGIIMSSSIKKEFMLEGLCCANCAAKIERKINELDDVSNASINLVTQTLTMEIKGKVIFNC